MTAKVKTATVKADVRHEKIRSFDKRLKACTAGKMPADQTAAEFEKLIREIDEAKKW